MDALNLNTFMEYRISTVFLLAFIYFFSTLRYSRKKSGCLLAACFFVLTAMEYPVFFVENMERYRVWFTLLESLAVLSTAYLISEYRDCRSLFVGLTAAAYVLIGNTAWTIVYIATDMELAAFAVQIILHSAVLAIAIYFSRALFLEDSKRRTWWGRLCFLPFLLYCTTYALTIWPHNIYEHHEAILGVVLVLLLMLAIYLLVFQALQKLQNASEVKSYQQFMAINQDRLEKELVHLNQREREVSIIRHDLRHYGKLLYSYLDAGEYDKIRTLLEQNDERLANLRTVRYCENIAVNGVLTYGQILAKQKAVRLQITVQIPAVLPCGEYEYATVVSNLLENAILAAAEATDPEKKTVNVKALVIKKQLVLEISNYFGGKQEIDQTTGLPISVKGKLHGYGLKSVQAFADSHGAVFDYDIQGDMFTVRLLVQQRITVS